MNRILGKPDYKVVEEARASGAAPVGVGETTMADKTDKPDSYCHPSSPCVLWDLPGVGKAAFLL